MESNNILNEWIQKHSKKPQITVPVKTDVVFNGETKNLKFGRAASVEELHKVYYEPEPFVVLAYQKDQAVEKPKKIDLSKFGTLCRIVKTKSEFTADQCNICFQAIARVRITSFPNTDKAISPTHVVIENVVSTDVEKEKQFFRDLLSQLKGLSKYIQQSPRGGLFEKAMRELQVGNPINMVLFLIKWIKTPYEDVLKIFEASSLAGRLELMIEALWVFGEFNKLESVIDTRFRKQLTQKQKEYFLREKITVYREELTKITGELNSVEIFRKKLKEQKFPENIKKRIQAEIDRYDASSKGSADANITRQYIETLLSLPWLKETEDVMDLKVARIELDKNHFGLEKVKERIIEQLAVVFNSKKKNLNSKQTSILCLVGPPGTGKTSLGQSIASAMGRKFVRVALGGIRDEAEIRGHRKTYVGAMPGRIIKAMKRVGVNNPLFLLDEIDKMASDYRGDPSAAMLEVLDPEQNKTFSDNYIEEDFDLSKVIFICTANTYDAIPDPLLDRMEVIHLSSYTELEKLHIAKDYLVAKALAATGLKKNQISFSDSGIMEIIRRYTREAGVRELQRLLEKIARVFLVRITDEQVNQKKKVTITKKNVIDYLKKPLYDFQKKDKKKIPGLVNGLAYTAYGGDVLPIEVTYFPGNGKLTLTGRLGEVFQESANISVNYIKSHTKKFGVEQSFFSKNDIHLHCPEGAVPKDGPSAGITITTAILSVVKGVAVDYNLGMTGEITLHGQVLGIGGLKEKVISAHRTGLKEVLYPKANVKDLDDIPEEIKKSIKMIPVETFLDVYSIAFPEKK